MSLPIVTVPAEKIKAFEPKRVESGEDTYNEVAALYDSVFTDIRVRKDEWDWLNAHLPENRDIRAGNRWALAYDLRNLALVRMMSGDLATAEGNAREAIALAEEIGDATAVGRVRFHNRFGAIRQRLGQQLAKHRTREHDRVAGRAIVHRYDHRRGRSRLGFGRRGPNRCPEG